jgi:hypothetical protein
MLGVQFHLPNLEIRDLVELRGPPRIGGPITPSKPQIQNTYKKIWLFQPNLLSLDI